MTQPTTPNTPITSLNKSTALKAYTPLVALINSNLSATVQDLLPQLDQLVSRALGTGSRSQDRMIKDPVTGSPFALYCDYHKTWELVTAAPFAPRKSSATGYASMCLEGAKSRNAQKEAARKAEAGILPALKRGAITAGDIAGMQATIAAKLAVVIPRDDNHSLSKQDAQDALSAQ